ncbi:hypothetical protein [Suttonella ornithocola]|uniref:Uncharacterized protein n=1 Tax=Suttonella ornithocola TaxID=279832 RepID=A0A380MW55_9GAMM|nr:hypothetical protein [Suttonella ornithocola]SUO96795.1 Uncharacterised protein [Suttonella ornithocola]
MKTPIFLSYQKFENYIDDLLEEGKGLEFTEETKKIEKIEFFLKQVKRLNIIITIRSITLIISSLFTILVGFLFLILAFFQLKQEGELNLSLMSALLLIIPCTLPLLKTLDLDLKTSDRFNQKIHGISVCKNK